MFLDPKSGEIPYIQPNPVHLAPYAPNPVHGIPYMPKPNRKLTEIRDLLTKYRAENGSGKQKKAGADDPENDL